MNKALKNQFIKWPTNEREKMEIQREFYEMAGLPGSIGCVDGTHINIIAPSLHEEAYVNRKDFLKLMIQLKLHATLHIWVPVSITCVSMEFV